MVAESGRRDADSVDRLIQEGLELYGRNRADEAILCWRRALALDASAERARDYLEAAGHRTNGGQFDAKVIDLQQARDLMVGASVTRSLPADGGALPLSQQAIKLIEERRYEEALGALYRLRESNPSDASVSRSIRLVKDRLTLQYARRMGHLDQVPRRALGEQVMTALKLSSDEQEVLALIDGIASYGDVLEISRLGRFASYRCLVSFLERGIIQSTPAPASVLQQQIQQIADGQPKPVGTPEGTVKTPPPTASTASAPTPEAPDFDALFDRAMHAYLRRNHEEALQLFAECMKMRPDDARVRHNLEKLKGR